MKNTLIYTILVSILPVLVVAVLGSVFVGLGMEWFNMLIKPSQWIPNFVIPIVWTVIYLLSAVTLFVLINRNMLSRGTAILFGLNGLFNVLWCLVFFALKLKFLGLIVILINVVLAILLIIKLFKDSKVFGYLVLIYPTWLLIASGLNTAIWILN